MMDAMNVHRNLEHFPILAFSNEPVSHLASNTVRKALDTVPDELHRSGEVDEELHTAYLDQSAYDHSVPQGRAALSLSLPIDLATVVVNDGDGIIPGGRSFHEYALGQRNLHEVKSYRRARAVCCPLLKERRHRTSYKAV